MSANPSTRWFWNDWDNDRAVALCSLAAQGLWVRMLSIAARAGGYVRVNGAACSVGDIAALVGRSLGEVSPLVEELQARGVFSRTRDGTIYNRRMVRDEKRRKTNRKNGGKGGNPALIASDAKTTTKSQSDNRIPAAPDKPGVGRSVAPLIPLSPVPKKETDADASVVAPAKERKRGSARRSEIADDWQPDERDIAYAENCGRSRSWVDKQAGIFRDRNLRDGTKYADWHAAWRTWVQRAPDFERGNGLARPEASGSRAGSIVAALGSFRLPGEMD